MKKYSAYIQFAIRVTIASFLLYQIYFETGWATTTALFIVLISLEVIGVALKKAIALIIELAKSQDTLIVSLTRIRNESKKTIQVEQKKVDPTVH